MKNKRPIVISVSGGKTSSYLAAKYPSDYLVFALVRIEDKKCAPKDKWLISQVEQRINTDFIATAEDDLTMYAILDLEQYLGRKIDWVTGVTFDEVVRTKGGWLPNKLHRYCTTHMKIEPIFYWWADNIGTPIEEYLGFRANETKRAVRTSDKTNKDGLLEFKATFEKHPNGNNKWEIIPWAQPSFPLIKDQVFRDQIEQFWKDKPVRFAPLNNCVGCFHRNPVLLRKMFDYSPNKMDWFANQEGGKNRTWRADLSYKKIKQHKLQQTLSFGDFSSCDSGFCGL